MLEACPFDPSANGISKSNQQPLALRTIGAGYSWPFPRATSNRRFVLVAVDYFTKWTEAETLANIRDVDVKKFMWKNIVTKFGVANSLISHNELQFDSRAFREFCCDLSIKNRQFTLAYPQSSGQAEAVNKTILNGLKKRSDGAKGRWAEELPNVLWAY